MRTLSVVVGVVVIFIAGLTFHGYTAGWHLSEEERITRTMNDCIQLITGQSMAEWLQSSSQSSVSVDVSSLPDKCLILAAENDLYRSMFEMATGYTVGEPRETAQQRMRREARELVQCWSRIEDSCAEWASGFSYDNCVRTRTLDQCGRIPLSMESQDPWEAGPPQP